MEEWLTQVDDCETREERLTDWERGFISDMGQRLRSGHRLTDNQSEKLNQIWERATAEG